MTATPSPPPQTIVVNTDITIRRCKPRVYCGSVVASGATTRAPSFGLSERCENARKVILFKVQKDGDEVPVGTDRTDGGGDWRIGDDADRPHFANVLKKTFRRANGDKVVCTADTSRSLRPPRQ